MESWPRLVPGENIQRASLERIPIPDKGDHDDIYRSTNGGKTWKPVLSSGATLDASLAPYVAAVERVADVQARMAGSAPNTHDDFRLILRARNAGGVSEQRRLRTVGGSGKTWQPPASMPQPNSALGHIAVSSDGSTWVWTPERSAVYFTRDRGATWMNSKGVPANTRIIADRVNPQKFYGLDLFGGKLFVSTDGAQTFSAQPLRLPDGLPKRPNEDHPRGDDRGGQDRIYATPGREGDLWLAAFDGLYHSADTGKTFTRLPGVQEIHAFGFGKAAPNANSPALYLVGVVQGTRGIFRSDDSAHTWVRINDDQHQWGLILHITGDPKQYGRVYVGTHGRGILYGDPVGR